MPADDSSKMLRNGRREPKFMSKEDIKKGKQSHWEELEVSGK